MRLFFLVLLIGAASPAFAKTTRVKTVLAGVEPLGNVLVIVVDLNQPKEIGRFLTEDDGLTPPFQVQDGLYRVIATCPYGICKTAVKEFLVSGVPDQLTIAVPVQGTDQFGVSIGHSRVKLVLDVPAEKKKGVLIIVRDPLVYWQNVYHSRDDGVAEIQLVSDPSVIVLIYDGKIYTRYISDCPEVGVSSTATQPRRSNEPCKTVTINFDGK